MQVNIHSALRRFTQGQARISIPESTVQQLLATIMQHHPQLGQRLLDSSGKLQPYVSVFINQTLLDKLEPEQQLSAQDDIEIITSLVGG